MVRIEDWVWEIIVDPLNKDLLKFSDDKSALVSTYGRQYPVVDGILDLRLLNNETTADQKEWSKGQIHYKNWASNLGKNDRKQDYAREILSVKEVYAEIPIEGRCLDVGGHQGRLRHFLSPDQQYVICEPFLNVFQDLEKQPNLLGAYPFLLHPVNFLCGEAEFLPFRSLSFQTVHMRSVIDHFCNPELALNEAYRVLEKNGSLIVGLFVEGGKHDKPPGMKTKLKNFVKWALANLGLKRFSDPHVWHPTYRELTDLISRCGFRIVKTHWVKGFNDSVCFLRAKKEIGLKRNSP